MRLYLLRAASVSQGMLFHLSEMNHFTSLKLQPVGAPKMNIMATLNISFHFNISLRLFLFVYSLQETDVMTNGEEDDSQQQN